MTDEAIDAYHTDAASLASTYDRPELLGAYDDLSSILPDIMGGELALDVGAGSGRDTGWLRKRGYEVVAVEPAAGMRLEGARRHGGVGIRWLDDRLPALEQTHRLGLAFSLILVAAVWQHVAPPDRPRAFRKLVTLIKPGGLLILTLRSGPAPEGRAMHETHPGEIEALARNYGLEIIFNRASADQMERAGVRWTTVCLRMPTDGTDALPLIRGIILGDDKSSTYKLALLRSVALIAEFAPATAVPTTDDDAVEIPLGLVALNWIRMYLPLVRLGLPQAPRNSGPEGLGFAKSGFRSLLVQGAVARDMRIGAVYSGDRAAAVASAIGEAASTIATMPANFIRFPGSDRRVFGIERERGRKTGLTVTLDVSTLSGWGQMSVPGALWRAMSRFGSWIDPMMVAEWARLIRAYGDRMGLPIASGQAEAALVWEEPIRDTTIGRAAATELLRDGRSIKCVWTGRPLTATKLDIDHCLPWSVWPCGDLWNLVPADPQVNRNQKRDKLPSQETFAAARDRVLEWWHVAWLNDAALGERFVREAAAALPFSDGTDLEAVYSAVDWRRLRLRQDQQVPEWTASRGIQSFV